MLAVIGPWLARCAWAYFEGVFCLNMKQMQIFIETKSLLHRGIKKVFMSIFFLLKMQLCNKNTPSSVKAF